MNKTELLIHTISLASMISGGAYSLDDIFFDSKIEDYSMSLLLEIIELLDEGYTEEEITEMINKCEFKNADDLNNKEKEYLRNKSVKTLKRIINNRKGE